MKCVLFLVLSGVLVFFSWASLSRPRFHGFYRLFAWEFMLGLFLLNVFYWFKNPLAPHQLLSWALLFLSAGVVLCGFLQLRRMGKADPRRDDGPLVSFEKTTVLVASGIYRYIRHPMYCSLLLLTWGIFFKRISSAGLVLAAAATFFLFLTVLREEEENVRYFGEPYREYMKRTKRFIPFLL
ncbi:MAG TPA: isoprenylcysteine carboxylmethyltransferase family protein [bacterium]|nr:isoprenylcysteine carboxylmethyltransferase family protein [bacterium]